MEVRKINLLKDAVGSYLEIQKDSLDETLRNNPFRRANIDSISEHNEFSPHSEEVVQLEKLSLLFPSARESDFIDCIYERIEGKKNLEQIILYGVRHPHSDARAQEEAELDLPQRGRVRAGPTDQADDRHLQERLRGRGLSGGDRAAAGAVQRGRAAAEGLHPVPAEVPHKQRVLAEAEEPGAHPAVPQHLPRHRTAPPT